MTPDALEKFLADIRRETEIAFKYQSYGNLAEIVRERLPLLLRIVEEQNRALHWYREYACGWVKVSKGCNQDVARQALSAVNRIVQEGKHD